MKLRAPLALAILMLVPALEARAQARSAYAEPTPGEGSGPPPAPPAPPALSVTPEEHARLLEGEVVLRTVKVSDDERWAEAIYLFDATPPELFDLVTDPPTQQDMFEELEVYEQIRAYPDGLETHGIANASWILPNFEYWLRTRKDPDKLWNAWRQTRGDFDANDGCWRFAWDPERKRTVGALTLHLGFKGILSIVPESWIVALQKANMPKAVEIIQERVRRVRAETPEIAKSRQEEWVRLADAGKSRPLTIEN